MNSDQGSGHRRRFGARVHGPSHRPQPPVHRLSSSSDALYSSNSLEFQDVASRLPISTHHRTRASWAEEEGHTQFNFSGEGGQKEDHGGPKYTSSRPKASGQSISTPGSSILSGKPAAVSKDGVLNNVFHPPATQDAFLTAITNQNTNQNRGSGATRKAMAYQTPSSLEAASAPPPRKGISQPPRALSGWVSTRSKTPDKQRTRLESTPKKLRLNDRKTSSSVTSHYSLRDRTKSPLFELDASPRQSFTLRNARSARLGKRKNTEGSSAQKPITLASDSDSEPEVQTSTNNSTTKPGDEGAKCSQKNEEEVQEEKRPAVDLEDIEPRAMVRIHDSDASTGGNEDSLSESDEDDAAGIATVLTYPLPPCTSDVVTIIGHDVSRLKPRRYLNDNIIDYYFKRLMLENFRDNELVQEKVLFLSSHFYSRLRAGKGPTARDRMEAGHKNVSTWLTRSNLFKRSIIFIPINKDVHWSLAVVLNPGVAGSDLRNEDHAFSCIAVLDPLGSYHRKAAIIRNLRAFLRMEWKNSGGCPDGGKVPEYGVEDVLTVNVNAPHQENSYDCGVYVLKFAEVIVENCLELGLLADNGGVIGKDVTDDHLDALITSSAFSAEDIRATRKQIRQYIEVDASEYQIRKKEKEKAKAAKA